MPLRHINRLNVGQLIRSCQGHILLTLVSGSYTFLFHINMFNTLKTIAIFIYMKYNPQHSGSQEMEPNCIDMNANFQRSKSGITSEIM